jgi:CRISPR-associated protein Cas8a1/Csx13
MAQELTYELHDPRYTIYHRAALGGLAATIRAWKIRETTPKGIRAETTADRVTLSWSKELTDREALQRILQASFLIDGDLIELPAQGPNGMGPDLRLALHNGYCGTFLQHHKMRPPPKGVKGAKQMMLRDPDSESVDIFTYQPVAAYAHQRAQGMGLLDREFLPESITISQAIVPGAVSGAEALEVSAGDGLLLLFLIAGSTVFLLRSRARKEKAQYCLVVPDVADLHQFARALETIAQTSTKVRPFGNTYLGRVVGGAEEAALKFLIDIKAGEIGQATAVRGCLAITMGKVAWDAKQINRSAIVPVRGDYEERDVFSAAAEAGRARTIKLKSGQSYAFPASALPELIAANLARGNHWAAHFRDLVAEKKEFQNMRYLHGGLVKMKEAIRDETDQLLIDTFHEAWQFTMSSIYTEAKEAGSNGDRKVEVRREKMRNDILRAKSQSQLANWFLDFCARATDGRSLPRLRDPESARTIRSLIFDQRQFDRFQNLCLFALLSYSGEAMKSIAAARKENERVH